MKLKVIHEGDTYVIFIDDFDEESVKVSEIVKHRTGEVVTDKWFNTDVIEGFKEQVNERVEEESSIESKLDNLSL
jgi:hypothetical protein